jgi:hypothetical protein
MPALTTWATTTPPQAHPQGHDHHPFWSMPRVQQPRKKMLWLALQLRDTPHTISQLVSTRMPFFTKLQDQTYPFSSGQGARGHSTHPPILCRVDLRWCSVVLASFPASLTCITHASIISHLILSAGLCFLFSNGHCSAPSFHAFAVCATVPPCFAALLRGHNDEALALCFGWGLWVNRREAFAPQTKMLYFIRARLITP